MLFNCKRNLWVMVGCFMQPHLSQHHQLLSLIPHSFSLSSLLSSLLPLVPNGSCLNFCSMRSNNPQPSCKPVNRPLLFSFLPLAYPPSLTWILLVCKDPQPLKYCISLHSNNIALSPSSFLVELMLPTHFSGVNTCWLGIFLLFHPHLYSVICFPVIFFGRN